MAEENWFRRGSSPEKLRGRYYTPPDLVRLVYERLQPVPGDRILDPACGDGEFLVGAVRHFAAQGLSHSAAAELPDRLAGFDIDPETVAAARARLRGALRDCFGLEVAPERLRIHARNALDLPDRASLLPEAFPGVENGRLVVAGNPPYVEAKRLSPAEKAALRRRYARIAGGSPDLYLYFLAACLDWLEGEDRLGLVLPNKLLANSSARALRTHLLESGRLQGVDFATRAAVFAGAAVYPIVLYAGGASGNGSVTLARVERANGGLVRHPLPALPLAAFGHTHGRVIFPSPEDPVLARLLLRMAESLDQARLEDVLDVRWTVSFHRAGLRERYVSATRPDSPHGRPFLGGGAFAGNAEVTRYRVDWRGGWIDYDLDRLRADGNPLPPPELFDAPRVVICQNGRTLRAAYDASGAVLKDTFLCGLPRAVPHPLPRRPRALVGLLCSRAVHFYYSHLFHGGHVNDGYLHFLAAFLADVPLGRWTDALAAEAEALVEERERALTAEAAAPLEERLEACVATAYDLSPEEAARLTAWSAADRNWSRRERTRV